jgi:hypothetical protein
MEEEKPDKFWKGEGKPADRETKAEKADKPKLQEKIKKIDIGGEKLRSGLAQLILTVIGLLRDLMEKQAIRRIEAGSLSDEEIERLGNTFMALKNELGKLTDYFKLEEEDLNFDLGPITARPDEDGAHAGKVSAVEILDRLLGKGVVVKGDVVISVAEVDLLSLNLALVLASIDKAKELYSAPATSQLEEEVRKLREENLRLKNNNN